MSATDTFYQRLAPFTKFAQLAEGVHYKEIPGDWFVVITDVRGSTKAIEEGRYKDVNLVGAATIAAVRNVLGTMDFPFVFGGDGASFAVPGIRMEEIGNAMCGLRTLSAQNFGLELRIGAVPLKALHEAGVSIEVAKYDLIAGRCITLFRGGGLTLAENWIKAKDSHFLLKESGGSKVSVKGLSCRWNAVPNQQGEILSILVKAKKEQSYQVYADLLERMDIVLDGHLETANPLNTHLSTYQSVRQCIRQERRLHDSAWSLRFWLRVAEIICCVVIFRFKIPPIVFKPQPYIDSMRVHADYRKFDDMLRMVIDVSAAQSASLTALLEEGHKAGTLYYGLHRSDSSLITCFVDDISDGKHIHFVDGSAGGYALAAKQLKTQMSADKD
jgi:hypothetical protein